MKVEMDVGKSLHGQPVKVIAQRKGPRDPWMFDLVKEPVGQRDDRVVMYSLPADVLEAIGRVAANVKKLDL